MELTIFLAILSLTTLTQYTHEVHAIRCAIPPNQVPDSRIDTNHTCTEQLKTFANEVFRAAVTFISLGAHFSKDTVNRLGFAEYYFKSASEKREHGIQLLNDLMAQGPLMEGYDGVFSNLSPLKENWRNGWNSLNDALEVETHLTNTIKDVISNCSDKADSDIADYLTQGPLRQQIINVSDLTKKMSALEKIVQSNQNQNLAEFLFDKEMLKGGEE